MRTSRMGTSAADDDLKTSWLRGDGGHGGVGRQ
uniref:Uncharacterized protein n=1 Tax=Arundo donax TaxID=35708 RepID=A0A0A9AR03_ARUDO